jgi:hypothetical protein
MSWKECSVMDERMQFVARRLAGEPGIDSYAIQLATRNEGQPGGQHAWPGAPVCSMP